MPVSLTTRLKQAARVLLRGYDAAGVSGRFDWRSQMPAPTTEGLTAHWLVGSRAAHASVNDPHVNAVVTAYCTDIVGDAGPSLQVDDETILKLWNAAFWPGCDAEGMSSLGHLLIRIMRCFVIYGEAFIVFRIDEETGALRLLVLPVAQIDASANEDLGDAGWIIHGIHIARDGQRVRAKVLTTPPDFPFATTAGDGTWIDWADICHTIDPIFPGAVRGISPLSPILARANELDAMVDARLVLQKVCALVGLVITDPSGQLALGDLQRDGSQLMSPGRVIIAPDGTIATPLTPPAVSGANDDIRHMLRSLAAGVGLPAWKVSADLSDVNFSSARLGDHAWRRRVAALQKLIEGQFLNRVFRRFVALEVAAGRLKVDLRNLPEPRWLWPAWPMVDPLAETQADALAVENCFTSVTAVIAARGRDPQEVRAEIAAEVSSRPVSTPALKVVEK